MKLTVDLTNKLDMGLSMQIIGGILDSKGEEKEEKGIKKTVTKTVKKKVRVEKEPEEKVELEDDGSPFDDEETEDKTEYVKGDVIKALNDFAKSHDREAAVKILKSYAPSGKISDIEADDYAAVIAELI